MQFETSTRETYRGERGEKGSVTKHSDNLRLEGNSLTQFYMRVTLCIKLLISILHLQVTFLVDILDNNDFRIILEFYSFIFLQKDVNLILITYHLGTYEGRRGYSDEYSNTVGDRASVTVREDNLRMEGDFIRKIPDKWEPGERAAMVKHRDNLLPPGPVEDTRDKNGGPGAGDRAPVVRHPDNLRQEGDFEKRRIEEFQVG